jgi:hypothetical protein
MTRQNLEDASPLAARIIGSVFGFGFCGIGLTLLIFLWSQPFDSFGSPPLVFRIFGSFISVMFVVSGGTMGLMSLLGKLGRSPKISVNPPDPISPALAPPAPGATSYRCPHCGASLPDKAEVSPLGDVKCPFCHAWMNIHQSGGGSHG